MANDDVTYNDILDEFDYGVKDALDEHRDVMVVGVDSNATEEQQRRQREKYYRNEKRRREISPVRKRYKRHYDDKKEMKNAHCAQYRAVHGRSPPPSRSFSRILSPTAPAEPYRRRKGEVKSVLHWGQRKLLLSEIEFLSETLTMKNEPSDDEWDWHFVYAGAAPGKHVNFLSDLFPTVQFHLYDPNPFSCVETDKIRIHEEYFVDSTATDWRGKPNVLFVSDIRTANPSELERSDVEEYVKADMDAQMRWHELMRPLRSMLKFRLPWGEGTTEYLDGTVHLPVWGPQTTTETRLIVDRDAKVIDWDNSKYEKQMFYFNTNTRVFLYDHDIVGEGIDHCYDCMSEIHILSRLGVDVAEMSSKISELLGRGNRTLAMPQPPPGHRGKMGVVSHHELAGVNGPSSLHTKGGSDGRDVHVVESSKVPVDILKERVSDCSTHICIRVLCRDDLPYIKKWQVMERSDGRVVWAVAHSQGKLSLLDTKPPHRQLAVFDAEQLARALPVNTVMLCEWIDSLLLVIDNVSDAGHEDRLATISDILPNCDYSDLRIVVKCIEPIPQDIMSRVHDGRHVVPVTWAHSGGPGSDVSWRSGGVWLIGSGKVIDVWRRSLSWQAASERTVRIWGPKVTDEDDVELVTDGSERVPADMISRTVRRKIAAAFSDKHNGVAAECKFDSDKRCFAIVGTPQSGDRRDIATYGEVMKLLAFTSEDLTIDEINTAIQEIQ